MFAKLLNNEIKKYPYEWSDFISDNNNTNYGMDTDILSLFPSTDLASLGYECVQIELSPTPTYDPITQKCQEVTPIQENGVWKQVWNIIDLSSEEITANELKSKELNKKKASDLLLETDWTTIPDVSDPALSNPYLTNSAEFAAYRSTLRMIAVNPPVTVEEWPVKPEEQWSVV